MSPGGRKRQRVTLTHSVWAKIMVDHVTIKSPDGSTFCVTKPSANKEWIWYDLVIQEDEF